MAAQAAVSFQRVSFSGLGLRAGLAVASSLLAIALGFVWTDGATATEAVRRFGYWMMAASFAAFLWCLFRSLREEGWPGVANSQASWRAASRRRLADWRNAPWQEFRRSIALMVLGGTVLCAVSEPSGFKILFDEYVLQATAQSLHLERAVGTIVRAYDVEGVWLPLGIYVDKRPYFFAFVLSLLHDFTGFRVANAFVLNHALTAALLTLVGVTVRRLTGRAEAGVLAGWCLAALPLVGQNTNGSGMELLNAVMIVGVLLMGLRLLERPDDSRQDVFLAGAVLLAQCRYESAIYVVAAAVVVVLSWTKSGAIRLTALTLLTPLALLPVAWVRQVFAANEVLWQLPKHLKTPFGTEHVVGNLEQALHYFFSFGDLFSNLAPLALAGVAGLLMLGGLSLRRRVRSDVALAAWLWFAVVLLNFVLLMHYYWGQLTDPLVSRLSLPIWLVFAVAIATALAHVESTGHRVLGAALAVSLFVGLALHGRATARHVYSQENILAQEIRWEIDWVAALPAGYRVVITNKSSLPWLLEHVPAILVNTARSRGAAVDFHLKNDGFTEILVTQRLRPTSAAGEFQLDPEDTLPPEFQLERLAERRFGYSIATISRVVAVEPPAAPPSHARP